MEKKLQKYIDLSLALYDPDFSIRSQHISIATYKNRIISIAKNSHKTNPIHLKNIKWGKNGENISYRTGTCSEQNCLREIKRTTNIPFNKITLYVLRVNRNKQIDNSFLCKSCQSLINFLGVENVYCSNKMGEIVKWI